MTGSNFVVYIDTQLRYHLKIEPENLSDEEWAERYAILQNIRAEESKKKPSL